MASSQLAKHPEDECRRWCKKQKAYLNIKRPSAIREYNNSMGGVDLSDRMLSFYRMKARTRKWTVRTIFHFFDLALVNSWILYRQDQKAQKAKAMQFLDFRISVAESLLSIDDKDQSSDESDLDHGPSQAKRPRISTSVPAMPQRTSGAKHLPIMENCKNSMRCRREGCKGKTKVRCFGCNVFLCLVADRQCFFKFHQS